MTTSTMSPNGGTSGGRLLTGSRTPPPCPSSESEGPGRVDTSPTRVVPRSLGG